ncbi:hypothetical protein [Endozoicomonas ascidiicola]|uniref:hypothetical protein n=1 Tax=Endozoicomonas ascidiicola TaxID=1698521 RepID=UPI0008326F29|nr:hypothetical protein [Endozoicomonas ascidiicola]
MSEEFEKRMLIDTLMKQAELMRKNAEQLEKLYGEYGYHTQLQGAAKITDDWAASIQHELGKNDKAACAAVNCLTSIGSGF